METSLVTIEQGPGYEVYGGETSGLRMDWKSMGVRYTYTGRVDSSCGELIARRLDAMLRAAPSFTVLHDFWGASGLDSQVRVNFVEWSKQHAGALASVHALTRSKVVSMSISTWETAVRGFKIYASRPEFDILCKKLGLPIKFNMPEVKM